MAKKPDTTKDAIGLLKADHSKVQKLFKEFEQSDSDREKEKLAATICMELTVHTTIEEEIFYPAAREALTDDEDLLDEADVEHASAKALIAQIESGSAKDDKWEAKVTVLGEYINHHVKEEQDELFPKCKKSKMDLEALGEQMKARKDELAKTMSPKTQRSGNSRTTQMHV